MNGFNLVKKIIDELKEEDMPRFMNELGCPNYFRLEQVSDDECNNSPCIECWKQALNKEYEV
jgi:hypothetical protein